MVLAINMVTKLCGFAPVYLVTFDCLRTSNKLPLVSDASVVARCLCIEGALRRMDGRSKHRLKHAGRGVNKQLADFNDSTSMGQNRVCLWQNFVFMSFAFCFFNIPI